MDSESQGGGGANTANPAEERYNCRWASTRVYLLDWLSVFGREQILVLRLEDHAFNRKFTMHTVFHFLGLAPLNQQMEAELNKSPASNSRRPADKNLGPMPPATKHVLRHFYAPFIRKLAQVLRNDSFLWDADP